MTGILESADQQKQPLFGISNSSFDPVTGECEVPRYCKAVVGNLTDMGDLEEFVLKLPPVGSSSGQLLAITVLQAEGVSTSVQCDGAVVVPTIDGASSVIAILFCSGFAWEVIKHGGDYDYLMSLNGLPSGGTTGQVLAKVSDDDYDVAWTTP